MNIGVDGSGMASGLEQARQLPLRASVIEELPATSAQSIGGRGGGLGVSGGGEAGASYAPPRAAPRSARLLRVLLCCVLCALFVCVL